MLLIDEQKDKVVGQLNGHTAAVNCVKWVARCDHLLISSSADKSSIIWDLSDANSYGIKHRLIGHNQSVMVCHSYQLDDNRLLSISSSTDYCTKIWLNDKQVYELITNNFVFDFKIYKNDRIFNNIVIMSVGANETINLYNFNETNHQMKPLFEIKGHEDWIRSIDIFDTSNSMYTHYRFP